MSVAYFHDRDGGIVSDAAGNHAPGQVRTGLSRVLECPTRLPAGRTGLCTNYTALTEDLRRGVDALIGAGTEVTVLFTPEHGYWGAAQAGASDGNGVDAGTGLPVVDTYGVAGEDLDGLLLQSGVQHLVVDLQDVGVRFYTYVWTLFDLLCSAARTDIGVVVLDRPNPLGARRAGPGLEAACTSFVGRVSIPLQHGLTLGELARWFNAEHVPELAGGPASLTVVELTGWDGHRRDEELEPWVMPSPNLPSLATAVLYPATCLLEGTTLSEGRGTTRPFELFGAPWADGRLAAAIAERQLPGVAVREAVFRPTFGDWSGETVHGAQLHLLDADAFDPVATGVAILSTVATLYPCQELWRPALPGRRPFIDLLWGSAALREGVDAGRDLDAILDASPRAPQPPHDALLYA